MVTIKTDNDQKWAAGKINLRCLAVGDRWQVRVLDAFGGQGVMWRAVKHRLNDREIKVLSIDAKNNGVTQLQGDNLKFMAEMDLSGFDIIDLDAWGSPVPQLLLLKDKGYKGTVVCTFIQSVFGRLNIALLSSSGISPVMFRKIPPLFNRDGWNKFKQFLAYDMGVDNIYVIGGGKKRYCYFNLEKTVK